MQGTPATLISRGPDECPQTALYPFLIGDHCPLGKRTSHTPWLVVISSGWGSTYCSEVQKCIAEISLKSPVSSSSAVFKVGQCWSFSSARFFFFLRVSNAVIASQSKKSSNLLPSAPSLQINKEHLWYLCRLLNSLLTWQHFLQGPSALLQRVII